MADVTLNMVEYLQLLEAVRELPAIHQRLKNQQDQINANRGLILEVSQKWDSMNAKKKDGDQFSITMQSSGQS